MNDFIFTHGHRWIGNYLVTIICLIVLFALASRKGIPSWLAGAAVFAGIFVILFLSSVVLEHESPMTPKGGWIKFTYPGVFIWYSATPIQEVCQMILGEDNVFEEHLEIPTALLMWTLVGAALGGLKAKFGKRTLEPGT
ncbi:hypothetical protein [Brevifollis gellanilyticus]|uniref:Uncharacterized protein n=1 Tax=Brevifollis gellanilyticus TaxID=748831 RepID=A0A512MAZ6_9BACT|nr:hypothetical protein [Brevifollis gellanilyticus]GEP43900.1 hypothetical protein BGE01nite_31910 [Brevifollis gellanilyticus]